MREAEVAIKTSDGDMDMFVCHPEEGGPHPAVVFYMDAPGIREELRDMARRIATVGYYVALPNLYYRRGREGDYGFDAEAKRFGNMIEMGIVDPAKVARAAIENAASVAGMVLTTESLITELNPPKLPAPYDD